MHLSNIVCQQHGTVEKSTVVMSEPPKVLFQQVSAYDSTFSTSLTMLSHDFISYSSDIISNLGRVRARVSYD